MKILSYKDIDRLEWSRLVQTSATGNWFQTPEAYDFFASQKDIMEPFVIGIVAYPKQPTSDSSLKGREEGPTPSPSFASVWGAHTADSTQYNLLKQNAIANRKTPTEAENIMWSLLKGNNLGLHFRRQHIILDYIVDFICLDKGLVIELDGGYHNELEQKEYDEQRTAHLQKLGYTELRFTNEELLCDPNEVIARIKAVAETLPSLQGRTEERPILRGVCVGYVTKEKSTIRQFFTRRAIINGGPCLADDATDEEVTALLLAMKNHPSFQGRAGKRLLSPIYIETRNFNDYSRWKDAFIKADFEYQPHLNFHIDCTDREAMEAHLSENRKRQIKRAIKSGVEIAEAQTEHEVAEWFGILHELYKTKVKTPLFPLSFFLEYYRQGLGKYLLVKYEGKIIGGIMTVIKGPTSDSSLKGREDGPTPNPTVKGGECDSNLPSLQGRNEERPGTIYEWFICGKDAEYKEQYPSVMATWAAMDYANTHGIARFDVMGAGEPGVPYGVRDFKSEFGGELVEHGRFIHVCKPWLYKVGKFGVYLLKKI